MRYLFFLFSFLSAALAVNVVNLDSFPSSFSAGDEVLQRYQFESNINGNYGAYLHVENMTGGEFAVDGCVLDNDTFECNRSMAAGTNTFLLNISASPFIVSGGSYGFAVSFLIPQDDGVVAAPRLMSGGSGGGSGSGWRPPASKKVETEVEVPREDAPAKLMPSAAPPPMPNLIIDIPPTLPIVSINAPNTSVEAPLINGTGSIIIESPIDFPKLVLFVGALIISVIIGTCAISRNKEAKQ